MSPLSPQPQTLDLVFSHVACVYAECFCEDQVASEEYLREHADHPRSDPIEVPIDRGICQRMGLDIFEIKDNEVDCGFIAQHLNLRFIHTSSKKRAQCCSSEANSIRATARLVTAHGA